MSRFSMFPGMSALACVVAMACGGSAFAQSRAGEFDNNRGRSTNSNTRAGSPPRPASPVVRTPGNLRRITELRPVGGDLRPVAGDIRPTGGNIGVTGGGLRPIEVRSPLQNDRSFEARLRPRTPRYGVTGYAVEPGWDDPPWGREPSGSYGRSGGAVYSDSDAGLPAQASSAAAPPAPSGETRAGRRYAPPAAGVARPAPSPPPSARSASPGRAQSNDDDWFDKTPMPSLSSRPRRDVRPDLRMAVRLTLEDRFPGAVDTVRHAVYREPEAFSPENSVFTDVQTREKVEQAIAAFRAGDHPGVSASDADFMIAALSASIGNRQAALAAIRQARDSGEDRPSGKALHRVLSRGEPTPSRQDQTPAPLLAPTRGEDQP